MKTTIGAAVAAVAMLAAGAAAANTTTNTFPIGAAYITSFHTTGQGGYVTAGQTFTAPGADTHLDNYTMGLQAYLSWDLGFYSVIQAWDDGAGTTVGSALYTSDVIHGSNQVAFTQYNFAANLDLTAGGRYIAYFSMVGVDTNPEFGALNYRLSQGDAYAAGEAWSYNTFENGWQKTIDDGIGHDMRVVLNYTAPAVVGGPVPEPATWMMMILGLGAAGALLRRRRVAVAA